MYLKRLEMNGFKSFLDAQIAFQPGITAVVGPNGTGKSNILDAILWVLGEQSTKTLRSERMEDVIFNGTESRKPQGMVEVSLILGEVDGGPAQGEGNGATLPYSLGECQEVMVTRRLFRDGISEYFINQTPCRLKDIRGLLLDTRAGSKGHTVIEQGMIDRLLKASPIERRELIEETAGIVRYKKQKAEALRKLEATHQNLLRVRDIVNEVKRQLGSLERQAKAAETYQRLRQEVRQLELVVLTHEHQEVSRDEKESERMLRELSDRESAEEAAIARLSYDAEAIQLQVTENDSGIAACRDNVSRIEMRLSQAATTIELLAQRSTFLEEQRARVQADLRHIGEERQQDAENLLTMRARLTTLSEERSAQAEVVKQHEAAFNEATHRHREGQAALEAGRQQVMDRVMAVAAIANRLEAGRTRAAELGRRIERLEQERIQATAALDALGIDLSACTSRRHQIETQLKETLAACGGISATVAYLKKALSEADQRVAELQEQFTVSVAHQKALQAVVRDSAIQPFEDAEGRGAIVAHVLTVLPEYDTAIEAVLGYRLMGKLVETPAEAVGLLEKLKARGANGGTFIPKRPRQFQAPASATVSGKGVLGPALGFVAARAGYEELVTHLLAGAVLVQGLGQALAVWQRMTRNDQALLVTVSGEVVAPDGTVTGRPVGAAAGVMARERELQALAPRVQDLEHGLREAKADHDRLVQALADENAVAESREGEIRRLEMELVGERKDEQRGEQDLAEWRQRIEVLLAEQGAAGAEREALSAAEHADRDALRRMEAEQALAEQTLGDIQERVTENQAAVERQQAAVTDLRLALAGLTERLEQNRAEITRLEDMAAVREVRFAELEAESARLNAAAAAARTDRQQTEAGVPAMELELAAVRQCFVEAQAEQMGRATRLRTVEAERNRVRHGVEELRRQQEAVRLRQREAQIRLEGYESQLQGTYGVSFEAAVTEIEGVEERDLTAVRERLAQRRGRLHELGPVNVMAIDEHRELEERLRFLTTQEEDLAQSVASLKTIIAKINRTTKQLFLDTFQELQMKFDEMFRNFFEGGRAELVLVEDEEAAEPGIDIVAQPPGKRLKNIAMLSGGERALTAMALIFASFVIRPTPFCVLDEIDAALDEENTVRFTRVLQDLSARSQFIVITHCKQTMEVADSLYGVTMEEPGISMLISVRLHRQLQPA